MRPETMWRAGLTAAILMLALLAGSIEAKPPRADEQLKFGVSMAKRGLWAEALFRFERARQLDPGNARILNNLAVAYEAVGRFEDALEMYREALRANPGSRDLKKNYSQFLEFYQGFRPEEPAAEGAAEPEPTPEEEPDEGDGADGSPAPVS